MPCCGGSGAKARQRLAGQDAARLNTPDWLWQSWREAYGEARARAIAEAHLVEPPLDLSVKDRSRGLGDAARRRATVRPTRSGARRAARSRSCRAIAEGAWWVQDAAAALPARLLGEVRGRPVIDLCAAPGGKTAQLAAAGAEVIAVELSEKRAVRLRANLERLRLDARIEIADALAWRPPRAGRPRAARCAVHRHRHDPAPSRHRLAQDPGRRDAHGGAAGAAARGRVEMLAPGGVLVYASCSLQPEEGPLVIEQALAGGLPLARVAGSAQTSWMGCRSRSRRGRRPHPALPSCRARRAGRLLHRPLATAPTEQLRKGDPALAEPCHDRATDPARPAVGLGQGRPGRVRARAGEPAASSWSRPGARRARSATPGSRSPTSRAVTGAPEILDGRVKTLHPAVHGGILARRDLEAHMATIAAQGIPPIDLVVVNLYPFEATVAEGAGYEATVEMIDVGGPAMIRAAAKNHASVTVVVDPADYAPVLESMRAHDGRTTAELRRRLAAKAFARTAAYDAAIARWFAAHDRRAPAGAPHDRGPARAAVALRREPAPEGRVLRDRRGASRASPRRPRSRARRSRFNNLADADAAFELVCELEAAGGRDRQARQPLRRRDRRRPGRRPTPRRWPAIRPAPTAASSPLNRPLDRAAAERIAAVFTEVVIAPDADAGAREVLATKPNLRLLLTGGLARSRPGELCLRSVAGGLLVQERDAAVLDEAQLKVVTARAPTDAEMARSALCLRGVQARQVERHRVRQGRRHGRHRRRADEPARCGQDRGGQGERGERRSRARATRRLEGSVVASDAFFPFADGLAGGAAMPGPRPRSSRAAACATTR